MISTGLWKDSNLLTVNSTAAHNVSIGQGHDSDIKYGVSDGTRFIGFQTVVKGNYDDHSQCYGVEGSSCPSLTFRRQLPLNPESLFTPVSLSLLSSWMNAGDRATLRMTGFCMRFR